MRRIAFSPSLSISPTAQRARSSSRAAARTTPQKLGLAFVTLWLGACATGVEGMSEQEGGGGRDAAITLRDSGGASDAADGAQPSTDAGAKDGAVLDAREPSPDAGPDTSDAAEAGGPTEPDASADAEVPTPDGGGPVEVDASGPGPDSSVAVDAGPPDAGAPDAAQPPVNCDALVRTGVQLCDKTTDTCGLVFTNRSGCSSVCAAGGLTCASAYENVELQCARDDTRPALACNSGHESDYCLCRRP